MTADEYKKIDWKEVYGTELELFLNTGETHVLNTLCMFLTDYNVNSFFLWSANIRKSITSDNPIIKQRQARGYLTLQE